MLVGYYVSPHTSDTAGAMYVLTCACSQRDISIFQYHHHVHISVQQVDRACVLLCSSAGPLLQPRGQTSVFYTVPPSSTQAAKQQQQHSFTAEESSPQAGSASQQGVVAGLKNDRSTDPDQ